MDLGWELKIKVGIDSSAAKARAARTGLDKTRHIEVQYLWVREVIRRPLGDGQKDPGGYELQ